MGSVRRAALLLAACVLVPILRGTAADEDRDDERDGPESTRFPTKFPTKFPTSFPTTKYPSRFPTKEGAGACKKNEQWEGRDCDSMYEENPDQNTCEFLQPVFHTFFRALLFFVHWNAELCSHVHFSLQQIWRRNEL